MTPAIPYNHRQPITISKTRRLLTSAYVEWGLTGGHEVEQFLEQPFRDHADVNVVMLWKDKGELTQNELAWLNACVEENAPASHLWLPPLQNEIEKRR